MEPEQPDVESKPELNIIQAIELAIGHEKEARKSYLSLSQETDDPELKTLLKEIAMEEASHEASLQSRLRLYQERHVLRDTFSRYVSPELCEEILKNPGLLALGGRRQQVMVLFADIRNFTSMSEAMAPEAVVEVLNTYFTEMVDLVFKYQGTLDKFVGDALMAVFGVPLPLPQAADRAVECALAMQRHLRQMQAAGATPLGATPSVTAPMPPIPPAGVVVAANVSESKGERKKASPEVILRVEHGIEGDAHAGPWHRQVSLLAQESIDTMVAKGLNVGAGDFAENITTIGIEVAALPIGTILDMGEALVEVTQIGKECHARCAIYYQAGDCVMPREGIFVRVLRGGRVAPGDPIKVRAWGYGA
jgi:MOSC domain-containing protein YiiM